MWGTKAPRPHRVWWTPCLLSPGPISQWRLSSRGRENQTPTDLFQPCLHPFKPGATILLSVQDLPQPPHLRRHLPSINAWRSAAIQSTSTPKVIWLHKHSNLYLLCALAAERAPPGVLSVVIYMKPLRWLVSVMCRAVMKARRFWMVRWKFQTLGACVQGRGHPRFKGRFHDTPAIRQGRFTTFLCVIRRKSVIFRIRDLSLLDGSLAGAPQGVSTQ